MDSNPQSTGWYCKKGYCYPEGGRFLYLNRRNFNEVCGSSTAYHLRQALFMPPGYYCCEVPPAPLKPLPFVGGIYSMGNGENIVMSRETEEYIRQLFKGFFQHKDICDRVESIEVLASSPHGFDWGEFGLYAILKDEPDKNPVVNDQAIQPVEQIG